MVPIGASSRRVKSCSGRPGWVTLGSALFCSETEEEPILSFIISSLNLCLISSAALLVNVSRTTSPGRSPGWFSGATVSEEGEIRIPPLSGGGLSGTGSILVAL